ncbi:DUF2807 domain-containing protein [bacterium]|nr:DUF2807 domain-containing protein [bacterium]MBU1676394.1 DUF2807 domain-containing protein [bacterium]
MAKRHVVTFMVLTSLIPCAGCRLEVNGGVRGNGDVATETRALDRIDAVALECRGDLVIALGDREELIVEAESNLIELIVSEVEDGKLTLRASRGTSLRPTRPIRFALTVRSLDAIRNTGSGDITAPRLRSERMDIELTGSGDLALQGLASGACSLRLTGSGDATIGELRADELTVRQSGSGDVEIDEGGAERFEARLSGSGDCKAAGFRARRASVHASGSGGVSVHVEDVLECRISGSGGVRYGGDPDVEVTTTGSGRAERR